MTQQGQRGQDRWLHRYAVVTALACLTLLGIGGLVTSHEAGMSVPDWPTSYGYNMFALPFSHWIGGALYEHSHRLVATVVGVLVVGLARWLGGFPSRRPLAIVGAIELVVGLLLVVLPLSLKGTGQFLMGIAGVVLVAAAVPARNEPAARPLPGLGWVAFGMVQLIGLLGGLRVVLYKDQLGIFHATLAQLFFLLTAVIALLTSGRWSQWRSGIEHRLRVPDTIRKGATMITLLVLAQLVLGATMRHQHAGLAIPDFPLAYGKLWPATDPAAIASYNQQRIEVTAVAPITAFQVLLQMVHRIVAVLIAVAVFGWTRAVWRRLGFRSLLTRLGLVWTGLILIQILLGAFTLWTNKAADVATLHMLTGALILALGGIVSLLASPAGLTSRRVESPQKSASPIFEPNAPHATGGAS